MPLRQCAYIATLPPSLLSSTALSKTSCHTSIFENTRPVAGRQNRHASHSSQANPRDVNNRNDLPDLKWPDAPKGHAVPTPYQILAMNRTDSYSKINFYHLVKKYHPDRADFGMHADNIPQHIRIERYRLVVAAHNILSDPSKRSAYDRFGLGWQGRLPSSVSSNGSSTSSSGQAGPFSPNWQRRNWEDPVWQNATWEDWERFHAHNTKTNGSSADAAQSPVYLSNGMFISIVFFIVLSGASMNYGRAQNGGQYFVDQRDLVHDRAAKELRRVQIEKQVLGNRTDRVEWFVRQRDATLGATGEGEAMRDELADKILPKDVCRSEEVMKHESPHGND